MPEVVLLGPTAVRWGDRAVPIRRRRERALLARLALAAPAAVPLATLIEDLWGGDPPRRATDTLRVHVSNLRKALSADGRAGARLLRTTPGGYALDLPAEAIDARRLELALRGAPDDAAAGAALRAALDAAGPPLADLDDAGGWFVAARQRLEDLCVEATEVMLDAEVAAGRHDRVTGPLEQLTAGHPYRERAWTLLVTALGRAGRRADALRAYQRARAALAEAGLEPGAALRAAEAAVLRDAAPPAQPAHHPPRRPPSAMSYATVDGSRVAYLAVGDGSTELLVLHGGFVPFEVMWEAPALAAVLDRLAARFRLVLIDRRGTGMSDGPTPARPVELDDWVADCAAVLDDLGCSHALVLGHEHGGPVAVALAASDARVRGVLLHSTAARPLRGPEYPHGAGADDLDRVDRMLDRSPGSADMLHAVAPSAGDDRALDAWLQRAGQLGAGPARARELHRMYLHSDVRHLLPDVGCPVTVVHPTRSAVVDPAHAVYLAGHLPDARLVLLDSADHLFWLADAARVLEQLDDLAERAGRAVPRPRLAAIVAARTADPGQLCHLRRPDEVAVAGDVTVATFGSLADALAAARAAASAGLAAAVHLGDVVPGPRGDAVDEAVRSVRTASPGHVVATDVAARIAGGAALFTGRAPSPHRAR